MLNNFTKNILVLAFMGLAFVFVTSVAYAGENIYHTDIAVLIDDFPVNSVIINDEACVDIEDFKTFGFEVQRNDSDYWIKSNNSEYSVEFLPLEYINIICDNIVIQKLGETEKTDVILNTSDGHQCKLYKFNETYFVSLRDLNGICGRLQWDSENRRAVFNITEFDFDTSFQKGLEEGINGHRISDDERLGLVSSDNEIEYSTYQGEVENFNPAGLGILRDYYINGTIRSTKGHFPEGLAEGRLIANKADQEKLLERICFGVEKAKLEGAYLYINYLGNFRIEGNYKEGVPVGEQRICALDNKYLYGYKVIGNSSEYLKPHYTEIGKLVSGYEVSQKS